MSTLTVHLPESLKKTIEALAAKEGYTPSQFLASAAGEKLAVVLTMDYLRREAAAKFSFLMSIPIMLAAGVLSTYQMVTEVQDLGSFLPIMAIGFITAMVLCYIAIRWLLKFLVNNSLIYFSVYCMLLGGITILVWAVK